MSHPARALVRSLRARCFGPAPLSADQCREIAEECLSSGLRAIPPAAACGLVEALARQAYVHEGLVAATVERMHPGAVRHSSPTMLRAWLCALVATRSRASAAHLDACLLAITAQRRRLPGVCAAPLLRAVMLAEVEPPTPDLQHGHRFAAACLSAAATGVAAEMGSAGSLARCRARAALADVAWLAEHRPPSWWRPPLSSQAALLEAARAWQVERQSAPTGMHSVESAVHDALLRLRSPPTRGVAVGHLQVPLAFPEMRLALECPGPHGELRGAGPRGAALPPQLELRHEQLRHCGWHVQVVRDSEWPSALPGEEQDALHRREELLLRRKLVGAFQQQVPLGRRRGGGNS